jgi:protein-tyrosine phosphatase
MRAEMYEITPCPRGRLAVMPRPRGGAWLKGELASLKASGVSDLVSLLTPLEEIELDLQLEPQYCAEIGLGFHRHPVQDRGIPLQPGFDQFIASLLPSLNREGFIAIHCRAGIGRSSVAAAAFLCGLGLSAQQAIALISHARGFDIPDTEKQLEFILGFDRGMQA